MYYFDLITNILHLVCLCFILEFIKLRVCTFTLKGHLRILLFGIMRNDTLIHLGKSEEWIFNSYP